MLFCTFACIMDRPKQLILGLYHMVVAPDILITDYFVVGGIGASFFNAGILSLISLFFFYRLKIHISGMSIATIFLVSGFSLFGKNIVNIWPIFFGIYLYSKIKKESFSKYIHTALLATSMAPAMVELMTIIKLPLLVSLSICVLIGILLGIILPPIAEHMLSFHQGFNLYNIGFAAGIIGTILVSVLKSYGYETRSSRIWSGGNDVLLASFLAFVFLALFFTGYVLNQGDLRSFHKILCSDGVLGSDFLGEGGAGSTFMNMSINGFVAMVYIVFAGGNFNGPTIGGILTVAGFGAYGKHIKNILPVLFGVVLGSLTKIWNLNDPAILIGALFGTALAPIAGRYGWIFGMLAGFLNSSVVLSVGVLHGGMNLYNTGFSSGIVAAVMIPLIRAFHHKESMEQNESQYEEEKRES